MRSELGVGLHPDGDVIVDGARVGVHLDPDVARQPRRRHQLDGFDSQRLGLSIDRELGVVRHCAGGLDGQLMDAIVDALHEVSPVGARRDRWPLIDLDASVHDRRPFHQDLAGNVRRRRRDELLQKAAHRGESCH